ncbi:MAG: hypothetical protein GSR84_03470 [Desulfurococcales archaeon]|nr:hypothetical protein [Desulfurococcales archaeon]
MESGLFDTLAKVATTIITAVISIIVTAYKLLIRRFHTIKDKGNETLKNYRAINKQLKLELASLLASTKNEEEILLILDNCVAYKIRLDDAYAKLEDILRSNDIVNMIHQILITGFALILSILVAISLILISYEKYLPIFIIMLLLIIEPLYRFINNISRFFTILENIKDYAEDLESHAKEFLHRIQDGGCLVT